MTGAMLLARFALTMLVVCSAGMFGLGVLRLTSPRTCPSTKRVAGEQLVLAVVGVIAAAIGLSALHPGLCS